MTEIDFHSNVSDKLNHACRLLRKAYRSGASVAVVGPADLLGKLDRELWSFEPLEFIPHASARESDRAWARHTRIWLSARVQDVPHDGVLVHLGSTVPEGFERFERLIEVVSMNEEDKQQARRRWKHYADLGYQISNHKIGASEEQG